MNFVLERVDGPDCEPITIAEMKRHLRCFANVTDEDDDITDLITAAREWVEDFTGRALLEQTWRLTLGERLPFLDPVPYRRWCGDWAWRDEGIYLRRAPVLSITEFASMDSAGTATVIDASAYELREANSKWPRLVGLNGARWRNGCYRITFTAGFPDDVVPSRFKQAMKLWAEAHYDRDEKLTPLLVQTAENLIRPERADLQIA